MAQMAAGSNPVTHPIFMLYCEARMTYVRLFSRSRSAMKKFIVVIAIVLTAGIVFVSGLRAEGIREGKWRMTTVAKMEGMTGEYADAMKEMENMSPEEAAMMKQMMGNMNIQVDKNNQGITTTTTQCISDKNPIPEMEKDESCKETYSIDGNTVNFHVVCSDSDSTGKVTYMDDSMEGVIRSRQTDGGQEVNSTIEVRGKYLGPCS